MAMFTYQKNCQCLSYVEVSLPYEKVEYSSAWLGICDGAMGSMLSSILLVINDRMNRVLV